MLPILLSAASLRSRLPALAAGDAIGHLRGAALDRLDPA